MTDQSAPQAQNQKRLLDPKAVVRGNLTADPELRYTQNQKPVVNFTIAQTERVRNPQTAQFEDGPTLFVRGTAWDDHALHIASSLTKGQRVVATGRLYARDYTSQNGNGTSIDLDVDEVGPSLRFGTAVFTRAQQGDGQAAQQGQAPQQYQQAPQGQAPQGFQQAPQGQAPQQYQQAPQQPVQQAVPQMAGQTANEVQF